MWRARPANPAGPSPPVPAERPRGAAGVGSVTAVAEPGEMDELRARLRRAEEDAAAARILAGGADRDVGEIRSELREFRTEVRSEFVDVRADIADVRAEVGDVRGEVGDLRTEFREYRTHNNSVLNALREDLVDQREEMNRGFAAVRGQLDAVAVFLQVLADRLDGRNGGDPRGP